MLRLDEPVPTPSGWTTIGDLQPGETIFGGDGYPTIVIHVFDIAIPDISYRLTFDDGTQIESCECHKWLTFNEHELSALTRRSDVWRTKRREKRPSRAAGNKSAAFTASIAKRNSARPPAKKESPGGTIRTTKEIVETIRNRHGRANHAIPVASALQLPEAVLPLDPYLLGVWLGDGTSNAGSVTSADEEIFKAFEDAGFKPGNCQRNGSKARTQGFYNLVPLLRKAGVFPKNKHVPMSYLRASRSQRLAILQGLMDTDGTVSDSGSVEFTSTNKRLAETTHELILSLGWKARLVEGRAKLDGRDIGPKWDIKWTASECVFRLDRKRAKQKLATRRTTRFRYVVKAEKIEPSPMRCIKVDHSDGLFLVGRSMIMTHNSDAILMAALEHVDTPGYSALILRRDFQRLALAGAIMDRAKSWLYDTPATWNGTEKKWTFPSGATLQFGYIDQPDDRFRYASAEYQFIGWDELTEFRLTDDESNPYTFLFSRLRKPRDLNVPLRFRAASNPGNIGHSWVKARFLTSESSTAVERNDARVFETAEGRAFVPAAIRDNPALDPDEYERQLSHLPPVTRARLMQGNWDVVESLVIPAAWLRRYQVIGEMLGHGDKRIDRRQCRRFATIDTAGTSRDKAEAQKGRAPSWSVVGIWDYWQALDLLCLRHVWRDRVEWSGLRAQVTKVLKDWECRTVRIENAHVGPPLRDELRGYGDVQLVGPMLTGMTEAGRGPKLERAIASGLINRLEAGKLLLPEAATWLAAYEHELTSWSGLPDETADQIDVSSYAAHACKKLGAAFSGFVSAGGM